MAPSKKRKSDAEASGSLVHAGAADPRVDSSWRKHCKVTTSATADGLVKIAWDSRYPFNQILNNVIPQGDREKAATMGFGPSMAAIKTYGLCSSMMVHLAESSFRQMMEDVEKTRKDFEGAMKKVTELQGDVKKYAENKSMLEGKITRVSRDAKNSAAKVKELKGNLETAAKPLGETLEKLKEVQSVPPDERYATLSAEFERMKRETVNDFDGGFHTAVAQFKVLHPGLDLSSLDIDKIVVDGRIVDTPDDAEEVQKDFEQPCGVPGETSVGVPFGVVYAPLGDAVTRQVETLLIAGVDGVAGECVEMDTLNAKSVR